MAITATALTGGNDTTNGTNFTTASITPSANKLILLAVGSIRTDTTLPAQPTISGNGLTWVAVHTHTHQPTSTRSIRTTVYRAMGAAPTSGAISIAHSASVDGCFWSVIEFDGVPTTGTNGSDAISEWAQNDSGTSNVSSLTVTLGGIAANGGTYAFFTQVSQDLWTAEAGYTKYHDAEMTHATPAWSGMVMFATNGDATPTGSNGSGQTRPMNGIAVEIVGQITHTKSLDAASVGEATLTAVKKHVKSLDAASVGEATLTKKALKSLSATSVGEATAVPYHGALPVLITEIGFSAAPLDALSTVTWTDVSSYVRAGDAERGRDNLLQDFDAGTCTLTLSNLDRRFDPTHTSGPYYPNIRPLNRVRLSVSWQGTIYRIFTGYVERWELNYVPGQNLGGDAVAVIHCVDALKVLNLAAESLSPYEIEVKKDAPVLYWRLGETVGPTAKDSSTANRPGTYSPNFVLGQPGLLVGDEDPGVVLTPGQWIEANSTLAGDFNITDSFTVELWLRDINRSTAGRFLQKRHPTAGAKRGWALQADNNSIGLLLQSSAAGNYIDVRAYEHFSDGKRHHVVFSYDGSAAAGGVKVYVDGSSRFGLVKQNNMTSLLSLRSTGHLTLGDKGTETENHNDFHSAFDEIALYSGALASSRVRAHYEAGIRPWRGERTSERVTTVLNGIGHPSADRDVILGVSRLHKETEGVGGALETMQSAALAELGAVYVGREGKVHFDARKVGITSTSTQLGPFGEKSTEYGYDDIVIEMGEDNLWTRVEGRRGDFPPQIKESTAQQDTFGVRTLSLEANWLDDRLAEAAADFVLDTHSTAQIRIPNMGIPPSTDAWADVFALEVHRSKATVKRRPPGGGSTFSRDFFVERVAHSFEPGYWRTDISLVPASTPSTFLIAGTNSVGDANPLMY